ncbi:MAG: phosphatase PAP2 family protein [Anaerolineales bacterium]|nr:phosphatase PAP2 family protein [Anaerolineales bacterium]MCW5855962.1 phosphatase PAP2 family protein [Anaerolineales bacterium]
MEKTQTPPPPPPILPKPTGFLARVLKLRRPVTVLGLLLAITLFLTWLPPEQRGEIGRAVLARRSLMVALGLFTLVSLSLLWARGQAIDNHVFLLFNLWGFRPRWLDILMWIVTQIGAGLVAIGLAIYLYFFKADPMPALQLALGTMTLALLVEGLKEIMNRARPYLINTQARVIGWKAPGRSFPSGHTAHAFFLVTLLNFLWEPPLIGTIGLFAVAVAVGITRMYVGAHFPRDVVAGSILGFAWGIFMILIDPFWPLWFPF